MAIMPTMPMAEFCISPRMNQGMVREGTREWK